LSNPSAKNQRFLAAPFTQGRPGCCRTIAYQWQISTNGGSTWANTTASGADSATMYGFTVTEARDGNLYRCKITDGNGRVTYTEAAEIVLMPIAITAQPSHFVGSVGDAVSFTVTATGTNLTYQWQVSTNGGETWANTTATGATTKTISGFELTEARVGNRYRCKITDGNGYVLYSEPAQLCKNVATVITQPEDFAGITGSRVEFSVEAVGPGLTYQWQVSGNGTTWSDSTAGGNTTASMWVNQTVGNVGNQYRCKVTDSAGNVVYSTPGTIRHASETWYYTYNADDIRTKATNGIDTYEYVYDGGTLSRLIVNGGTPVYFIYDGNGNPLCFSYGGSKYYYATNLQGDITAIVDHEGDTLVKYTYDAWGKPLTMTGSRANDLGILNPLRYRGYVYDDVTQLYYLQSRYYDPEIGRFINADGLISTGQGLLGYNMFAYCGNNPVSRADPDGERMEHRDMTIWGMPDGPWGVLERAPEVDFANTPADAYNCFGSASHCSILAVPPGYRKGDSTRNAYNDFKRAMGSRNVRELASINDIIGPDEYRVAIKCGAEDVHFMVSDGQHWYNKSGSVPIEVVSKSVVEAEVWYSWDMVEGERVRGSVIYDDETIYCAVKIREY